MKALGTTAFAVRLVALLATLAIVAAACGGDDDSTTDAADNIDGASQAADGDSGGEPEDATADGAGNGDEAADAATDSDQADDGAADDGGDDDAADTSANDAGEEPGRTSGRFFSGDTYDDGEFRATYRGMAQIPVGPDVFEGGSCYALLFDVTYLDPVGLGSNEFRPSVDAYLDDGTTATNDQTGVGCDATVLEPAGYAWLNDTTIEAGQTVTGHLTAFHVASGIVTDIDTITIYGGLPSDGGFDPMVTAELRSPAG